MNIKNFFKNHSFEVSSDELNNFIKWSVLTCVGVLTLFLFVKTINEIKTYAYIGEDGAISQNIISVSGKSEMYVLPDITTFTFSVDSTASTIVDAQNQSAQISNKALAFLKEKGIKPADIKTINYYTNTKYKNQTEPCLYRSIEGNGSAVSEPYNPDAPVSSFAPTTVRGDIMPSCSVTNQVPSGYETYHIIEVKVRNIRDNPSLTGDLVAGLGQIGVKVSNPYSVVDEPEKYRSKVRQEAILKARREAEVLAKVLGVKLDGVVGFNDNDYPIYPMYGSAREMDAISAPKVISPEMPTGANKITSEVTVMYKIK
jgi:uncharacterized protein YggE